MAIIDLSALEPTTISRDLKDKYILLYGLPKTGKTSFAAQIPNNLILCFEKGVNFINGVYAVDIPKWSDFKAMMRQLGKEEVKNKYTTITLDTISIAWSLCEQYVCDANDVKTVADIPWGRGYQLVAQEFSNALREISMLGYGMILITHAKVRIEKVDEDNSIEIVSPNIPERAQVVVNSLVDILGYIKVTYIDEMTSKRELILRGTASVIAGSRLKYLPPKIPFGYQELVDSIANALEMQQKLDGATITDKSNLKGVVIKRPFAETLAEAKEIWSEYVGEDVGKAENIMIKVEQIFGQKMKLSEIPESKQDLFEILIEEMRSL